MTALSVMLAAYGFFYNALKGHIEAGTGVAEPSADPETKKKQLKAIKKARNVSLLLGLIPLMVWLIFLKEVVDEIGAGFDVGFSLDHYSAINVAFILLANSWLLIAVIMLVQAGSLHKKRDNYT